MSLVLGFSCQPSASDSPRQDGSCSQRRGREAAGGTKAGFDGQLGQLETTDTVSLDLFPGSENSGSRVGLRVFRNNYQHLHTHKIQVRECRTYFMIFTKDTLRCFSLFHQQILALNSAHSLLLDLFIFLDLPYLIYYALNCHIPFSYWLPWHFSDW